MSNDRLIDDELLADVNEPEQSGSNRLRRKIIWLQGVAFVLGLALLVYVIRRVGVQPIFDALLRIGFGFFILLAISGSRHILRTLAMRASIPPEHRRFSFRHAFAVRLGGEAISFLTFTGPLLGEATKVALLRKRVPLVYGVSALVVDNILYNLSVAFFILSGAVVMLLSFELPPIVRYALFGIAAVSSLGLLLTVWAASRRVMVLTWLIDRLGRFGFHPKFLTSRRDHISDLESHVYDFYSHRPGAFFAMIGFNLLSHASSVIEVYVTLRMLGYTPFVHAAYVIESLTKVINFVFGFVPGTVGVYEYGTKVILQTLGYTAATGVALALVRKAGTVIWTVIGLIVLAWRTVPNATRRLMDRSPRFRKLMDSLVLSNMSHRPARTIVSVAGIAIGVLLIVFTVGLAHGLLRERGRREANIGAEIMVRASGTFSMSGTQPFAVPVSHAKELAGIEGVRAAVPIGQNIVSSDSGFGSRIVDGIQFDEYAPIAGLTIKEGTAFKPCAADAPSECGDQAIVDTVWVEEHQQAGVGTTFQLYDRPFRVVGIYQPPGGPRIKIPLTMMQQQLGVEDHCSAVLVACANPAQQDAVAARIRQQFPTDQILFTRDLPELYASGVPALDVFIKVVVAIASAISMLVVLLAMYTTVTERTRQIGILKSLGMSKRTIAWVIEKEAIVVSLLGVIAGILLTLLVRFAVMRTTSLVIEIEPQWIAVAFGVGLIGGTIGALYPALRAARQDAVEALAYE
ncbi:MAG: putative transport system permease protein [Acidobacteriota bacterium]|jgi:putative ABC transport system permease protein|nr:putative transport system permease protein [Acidobacteriota bacterium]